MTHLFLIRGLPGAGKSTLGNLLCPGATFSADDWFGLFNNGVFDKSKLTQAHDWCQRSVRSAIERKSFNLAVANTFTEEKELKPYLDMASEYPYVRVYVIVVEGGHKSTKDVPTKTIEHMAKRFEHRLGGWQ
jgi:predicted kinase